MKKLVGITAGLSLALGLCVTGFGAETASNHMESPFVHDSMNIAVYDDTQGIGEYSVDYLNDSEFDIVPIDENVFLVLYNGSFVPYPGIVNEKGTVYVPLNILAWFTGSEVTWLNDTRFTISNEKTEVTLEVTPGEKTEDILIPLRGIMEKLGAEVGYIDGLTYGAGKDVPGWQKAREAVKVITIEDRPAESVFTAEEGLALVKELSAQTYENLLGSMAERHVQFSEFQPDYDSQAVTYSGYQIGPYYVYQLAGFEEYPLFVNGYTGEIFSEKGSLPFNHIDKGFINISWLYQ